ncbi:MFS transporter [Bacillus dakarensis]|uniref:MFS transporter n=1 Tax=Robertmurraya dakarensis TaxID=1926278 RepID=UPI000981B364|nr:MFS transporter [Bacillus dakarensis]
MVSNTFLKLTALFLTVIGVFVASNIYTLIPLYGAISQSLQIKETQVVLAGSLFTVFYAIGLLYFGPASDRYGRKKVIVVGLLASAISTLAVGLSDSLVSLLVSRSIQGLTLGSFAPVAFAYSFDLFSHRKRTLLLVFINTGFLMAGIIGQLISSTLSIHFQWEYVFYFFAICYFLLFISAFIIFPKAQQPEFEKKSVVMIMIRLLKNKSLLKCYGITFTLLFSFVALYEGFSRFYDGTTEELFVLRAVGLTGAILSLFTGKLIDKFGTDKTLFAGLTLSVTSIVLMVVFQSLYALMFFSVLFVASISLLIPTIISLIGMLGALHRAKALSLYSFILLIGASVAPPVAMVLNFQVLLLLLAVFFFFNMISGYLISKELKAKWNYPI